MSRWVLVLFRLGTILISISLALFLVSLIPSSQSSQSTSTFVMFPLTWQSYYSTILSPQLGVHIHVTGSGAFKVYILEVAGNEIYEWAFQHYQGFDYSNITVLDEFLNAHPNVIARLDQNQNRGIEYDFIPATVTNVTLFIANPTAESITLELEWNMVRPFGPSSITFLSEVAFVTGVLLILPRLRNLLISRRQKTQRLESISARADALLRKTDVPTELGQQ
jgi:hypothetical protein